MLLVWGLWPSGPRMGGSVGLSLGRSLGPCTHFVGRVMMRVEKSNRSRLILRRFCTSSSNSVIRIRSWSWPPSTFWEGAGLGGGGAQGGGPSDILGCGGAEPPPQLTVPLHHTPLQPHPSPWPYPPFPLCCT